MGKILTKTTIYSLVGFGLCMMPIVYALGMAASAAHCEQPGGGQQIDNGNDTAEAAATPK